MMNANELRINNWVEYEGRYFQLYAIDANMPFLNTAEFGVGVVDYNNIFPIPLSPEILEKCEGFIKQVGTPNNSKAIYFDFVGYRIYCTDAFCSIHFDAGDWFPEIRKINNLHTFQNWYYFNTGHELTCKP